MRGISHYIWCRHLLSNFQVWFMSAGVKGRGHAGACTYDVRTAKSRHSKEGCLNVIVQISCQCNNMENGVQKSQKFCWHHKYIPLFTLSNRPHILFMRVAEYVVETGYNRRDCELGILEMNFELFELKSASDLAISITRSTVYHLSRPLQYVY